jgi:hypothetical protein
LDLWVSDALIVFDKLVVNVFLLIDLFSDETDNFYGGLGLLGLVESNLFKYYRG